MLAERAGLRIHEVPVDWVDDPDSRVDIVATALADLRGIARLRRALATGRAAGRRAARAARPRPAAPTRARRAAGLVAPAGPLRRDRRAVARWPTCCCSCCCAASIGAQAANLVALLVTAVANTAANRRLTFGVRGRGGAARHQLQGLVVFGLGLALTSGSLAAAARASRPTPAAAVELAVLVVANPAATVLRFVLFRGWVFRRAAHRRRPPADARSGPMETAR